MFINAMTSCLVKLNGDGVGQGWEWEVKAGEAGGKRGSGGWEGGGRIMRYTFKF